jgi:hypothetical protein
MSFCIPGYTVQMELERFSVDMPGKEGVLDCGPD